MTLITHLATGRLVQSRLTPLSGNRLYTTTVTAVMASLQPLSEEKSLAYGGVMTRKYVIHADVDISVQEGDRFRDALGITYRVVKGGVTMRSWGATEFNRIVVEQLS